MKNLILCSMVAVLFTALVGCSSNDDDFSISSPKSIEILSNETSQITCSDTKAVYSSKDEYIATVSENGLISAKRIGETYIDVNGQKSIKVTVKPLITSFTEPQLLFGATKDEVYSKVGTNYSTSNDSGIGYITTSGRVKGHVYLMEDGKVTAVCMLVSTIYIENLTNFLLERYMPATFSEENYTAIFINALSLEKTTIVIGEQVYSTSLMNVIYMPYDHKTSKSRGEEDKQKFINQANKIIKQLNLQ